MSVSDTFDIAALVEEINAAEQDPAWMKWTRDRLRLQARLHGLRTERNAALRRLHNRESGASLRSPHMTRRQRRVAMTRGLLSLAHAVELLPMKDSDARSWLRERGLVGDLAGREVVDWDRVVEAAYNLHEDMTPQEQQAPQRQRALPRVRLGAPSERRK